MIRHAISNLNGWLAILAIVLSSSAGDVLLSRGMKQIGDLGKVRRKHGLNFVIMQIFRNRYFLTAEDMEWFLNHYVGTASDLADPMMSPLPNANANPHA